MTSLEAAYQRMKTSDKQKLAFIAICLTQSGCSAITPLDDYITTHNLYGNLCKEFLEQGNEVATDIASEPAGAVNLTEGSIQNETNTKQIKENPEGVL